MNKGFKFNYTVKAVFYGGCIKSFNFMDYEKAKQAFYYFKNCTSADVAFIRINSKRIIDMYFGANIAWINVNWL